MRNFGNIKMKSCRFEVANESAFHRGLCEALCREAGSPRGLSWALADLRLQIMEAISLVVKQLICELEIAGHHAAVKILRETAVLLPKDFFNAGDKAC